MNDFEKLLNELKYEENKYQRIRDEVITALQDNEWDKFLFELCLLCAARNKMIELEKAMEEEKENMLEECQRRMNLNL